MSRLGIPLLRSWDFLEPDRSVLGFRQINVVREITPTSPLRQELGERADHCDYPDGKVVLIGAPDRHVNHSCDPNAYVFYEGDRSFLMARRDIEAGEEITCDYNINITGRTAWPCHCGAVRWYHTGGLLPASLGNQA
jgi:SET domain